MLRVAKTSRPTSLRFFTFSSEYSQSKFSIYGTTLDGHSVQLDIPNIELFFYLYLPNDITKTEVQQVVSYLAHFLQIDELDMYFRKLRKYIMYHFREWTKYIQVNFSTFQSLKAARDKLYALGSIYTGSKTFPVVLYEGDITPFQRFYQTVSRNPSSWLTVRRPKYQSLDTTCQLHATAELRDLKFDLDCMDAPTYNAMIYDIESASLEKDSKESEVLTIAAVIYYMGRTRDEDQAKTVYLSRNSCLEKDAYGEKVEIIHCSTEGGILREFSKLILDYDVDIISGYNSNLFDTPYLLARSKALKCHVFRNIGKNKQAMYLKPYGSPSAPKMTVIPGRIQLDLMDAAKAHKLNDYKLRTVCSALLNPITADDPLLKHFPPILLKQTKEDLHHTLIAPYARSAKRQEQYTLGLYNLVDTTCTLRLFFKTDFFETVRAHAKVNNVNPEDEKIRGQSYKQFCRIFQYLPEHAYVLNIAYTKKKPSPSGGKYEGAYVFPPVAGAYTDVGVLVLDYKSEYPSVMRDLNVCLSTYIDPKTVTPEQRATFVEFQQYKEMLHQYGQHFVFLLFQYLGLLPVREVKFAIDNEEWLVVQDPSLSIIPRVQKAGMDERAYTKKLMKLERDPHRRGQLNRKQNALKVGSNSIYGALGLKRGPLSFLPGARTVTHFGRLLIQRTAEILKAKYPDQIDIVYGDTDSVMVKVRWKIIDRERDLLNIWHLGEEYVEIINAWVRKEIGPVSELELEKIYFPYYVGDAKKQYFGEEWVEQNGHMISKGRAISGVESQKRDRCAHFRKVLVHVIDLMLKREINKLGPYLAQELSKLVAGLVPIDDMGIIKSLGAEIDSYASQTLPAHVMVAKRMRDEDKNYRDTHKGSRITYGLVRGGRNVSESAYSIEQIKRDNMPLDIPYYIRNHYGKVLIKILRLVVDGTEKMLRDAERLAYLHGSKQEVFGDKSVKVRNSLRKKVVKSTKRRYVRACLK